MQANQLSHQWHNQITRWHSFPAFHCSSLTIQKKSSSIHQGKFGIVPRLGVIAQAIARIPYESLDSTKAYELRLYQPRYVVEMNYRKRDEAYIAFDKYLTGANESSIKLESPAPVIMKHGLDEKLMQMLVLPLYSQDSTSLLDPPPNPLDGRLGTNIAGGEVVASIEFPGQATRDVVESMVKKLKGYLANDNISLGAEEEGGVFRVAQYDPVHSLSERKNEVWLAVKL